MSDRWVVDSRFAPLAPKKCTDWFGHEMDPAHQCETAGKEQEK